MKDTQGYLVLVLLHGIGGLESSLLGGSVRLALLVGLLDALAEALVYNSGSVFRRR